MKKALAMFLTFAMLSAFCGCQKTADAVSETVSTDENGVVTKTLAVETLDTAVVGEKVRDREVKDGSRLFIDADNPLFLFRPAMPFYSMDNYLQTYHALPEDLKAFSAVLAD